MKIQDSPRGKVAVSAAIPNELSDPGALFDGHLEREFAEHDVNPTLETMIPEPYVHCVPIMTGGLGGQGVRRLKSMGKLKGKIALITGGDNVIGVAAAKEFVNEGAYVFITGQRDADLAEAIKEIGRNVTGVEGDVPNLRDLNRLFAQIKREKGKLDIVFASNSIAQFAPFGKITEEHDYSTFDISVKGLLFTVQKALPLLPDGAAIILNASVVAGNEGSANSADSATAVAVRSFGRTWATDLKVRRIRVNVLNSGPIGTLPLNDLMAATEASQQGLRQRHGAAHAIAEAVVFLASDDSRHIAGTELLVDGSLLSNNVPLGRLGTPDEIAKAVVFLASDASRHITGMELFVGAGFAQL
jgi:NAD(P)-dependent dehydrogenase (short-subunit alcohol dehydrogenase family)